MRSLTIFSFLIAVACAASLGHQDVAKAEASKTIKMSVEHAKVNMKTMHAVEPNKGNAASASGSMSKTVVTNEIEGIHKLEAAVEIENEKNKEAFDVGTKTLAAFSKVLSSGELMKSAEKPSPKSSIPMQVNSSDTAHSVNHVHSRQTGGYVGASSEIIQNGGLLRINNGPIGLGNGGIVTSERLINTGGLISNGGILRSGGLSNNGGIISIGGNAGLNEGLTNSGILINSGRQLGSGGLIGSGQVLNAGQINSGGLIATGGVVRSGIQGTNNGVLVKNYGGGIIGNSAQSNNQLLVGLDALDSVPQTVQYSKQFFHFEAPEEEHEEGQVTQQLSNILKKNLQVVFVKAPENAASTNAALQLAKQAIEQNTAIFVLSKEAEAAQLVGQLEQIQENVQTAPEVRVVKYRTPEDLEHAKQDIQVQYEATGGSSESFNGGVVPVLNYASGGEAYKGIGTLLGPGIISSSNGHNGESSNIVSSISGGGQSISSGREALLGSSIGQLNIIKNSNAGLQGLAGTGHLISGSSNVYDSSVGSSNQIGNVVLGSKSGSSKFFGTGPIVEPKIQTIPLVSSSIGSSRGSIGSGLMQGSQIISSGQSGSGSLLGANLGSGKYFESGPLVSSVKGSNIGSSIQSIGSGSINSLGSHSSLGSNTGYTRELGSNLIVGPIYGSSYQIKSDVVPKTTSISSENNSPLLNSYTVQSNDGFGSSSLQAPNNGILSGSLIGTTSNVIGGGSQTGSAFFTSKPTLLASGFPVGSDINLSKQTNLLGSSNNIQSGSLSSLGSNQIKFVESNQGSSKLTGGNLVAGSGLLIGPTTVAPKLTGTSFGSGVGASNTFGSSSLVGSSQGSVIGSTTTSPKSTGTSFVPGVSASNTFGSGSLLGSSQRSSELSGGNFIGGSGSVIRTTTASPKSTGTSFGSGVGASNTFGSGSLVSSSQGSSKLSGGNVTGGGSGSVIGTTTASPKSTGTSFGSGVGTSNTFGSGSLVGSSQGSSKLSGGNVIGGSGSVIRTTTASPKSTGTSFGSGVGTSNTFGSGSLVGSNQGSSKLSGGNVIGGSGSVIRTTTASPKSTGTSFGSGVGTSNAFGSGSLVGSNQGSSKLSGGNVIGGSGSVIGSIIASPKSGTSFGSGVGTSNAFGSGPLVGSSQGSSKLSGGNVIGGSGSVIGSTTASPKSTSFGSGFGTSNTFGSGSALESIQGSSQLTGGNIVGGSGLVIGSTTAAPKSAGTSFGPGVGASNTFGSGSLVGSSQGSSKLSGGNVIGGSGSVIGSTTASPKSTGTSFGSGVGASNTFGSGSLVGSSQGSVKGSTTALPKSTGTSFGSGVGASNTFGSGSLVGSSQGSVPGSTTASPKSTRTSFVSGVGASNTFGSGSSLGSSQGSSQLLGGNIIGGIDSVVGSTTVTPKSTGNLLGSGIGTSNNLGSGSGSSSAFGSGTKQSSVIGSGSSTGSSLGSYASRLVEGTGSTLHSGSGPSNVNNDNVSVLSSTRIDHGKNASTNIGSQNNALGSGILLGSSTKSGNKIVSGLGIGSTIGEIVKVNN